MTIQELVQKIRDAYVVELRTFVAQQRERVGKGGGDVKFQLDHRERPFDWLYCVDCAAKTPEGELVVKELSPSNAFSFGPIEGMMGQTEIRFTEFLWDDVEIEHDLTSDLVALLKPWFENWFDPDDVRLRASADGNCPVIHALRVAPGRISIDFGSSGVEAFWELLALLRDAGAESLEVGSSRARANA